MKCNGHESLCEKNYTEVIYPTAHNAFSYGERGSVKKDGPPAYIYPNQNLPISNQLRAGIRGFMLDIQYYDDLQGNYYGKKLLLCHSYCVLGSEPLENALKEIKIFLNQNPNEVITLFFQMNGEINFNDFKKAFEVSGLYSHLYNPDTAQWPKLKTMIANRNQVVVFGDPLGGQESWLLDSKNHYSENNWNYQDSRDFSCADSPGENQVLNVMNHFITAEDVEDFFETLLDRRSIAKDVNKKCFVIEHMVDCHEKTSIMSNFPTVDFYKYGNVLAATNALNGFAPEVMEHCESYKNFRSLKAYGNFDEVKLEWKMRLGHQAHSFIIERSDNEKNYIAIGWLQNVDRKLSYEFIDDFQIESEHAGEITYRVKAFNQDGSTIISPSEKIRRLFVRNLKVFPNPIPRGQQAKLSIEAAFYQRGQIQVVNQQGQLFNLNQVELYKGVNTIDLPQGFQSGPLILNYLHKNNNLDRYFAHFIQL